MLVPTTPPQGRTFHAPVDGIGFTPTEVPTTPPQERTFHTSTLSPTSPLRRSSNHAPAGAYFPHGRFHRPAVLRASFQPRPSRSVLSTDRLLMQMHDVRDVPTTPPQGRAFHFTTMKTPPDQQGGFQPRPSRSVLSTLPQVTSPNVTLPFQPRPSRSILSTDRSTSPLPQGLNARFASAPVRMNQEPHRLTLDAPETRTATPASAPRV